MPEPRPIRFLTIPQVADELATSEAQIIALVRRGDLPALKLGGRGQWRIERKKLEAFIAKSYEDTAREMRRRREVGLTAVEGDQDDEGVEADEDYRQEEGGEG